MQTIETQQSYAFEGLDGSGKTTIIAMLVEDLEALGLRVAVNSSPGKTWTGHVLKECMAHIEPNKKNELFTYDIRRTERTIPHTVNMVLWDRHLDSVVVSNGDDANEEVAKYAEGIVRPHAVIYLDISPDISWERESKNTDHPLDTDWLRAKHRRYHELMIDDATPDARSGGKFVIFDASKPLEKVYASVRDYFLKEAGPFIERNKAMYELLLETPGIIQFLLDNPVEVKPDVYLPMFVNLKNTWSTPDVRSTIVHNLAQLVDEDIDWIIGLESGGSYYAVALANMLGKPVSLLRKNVKEHGNNNYLVGEAPPVGSKVVLVDDVYATGQSASRALEQLALNRCRCSLVTIFSYSNDKEIQDRLGISGTALTYFKGILHRAKEKGLLNVEQATEVTKHVDKYRNTRFT